MNRIPLFPRSCRCWGWILIVLLLFCHVTPALADEPTPGTPPQRVDTEERKAHQYAAARTSFAVNPQSRQAALTFFQSYHEVTTPAHNWSGDQANCAAGDVTADFRAAIVLRINYFRAMAGVPAAITLLDEYNQKAQQAALMMSANKELDHTPPADWDCYSTDGASAAGHANLYLGVFGPAAIDGYIQDSGDNNDAVGHRRWILNPRTQFMGTGDIPGGNGYRAANALWVIDNYAHSERPATREEFVAWPPAGYVPYPVVFPRWSFAYPAADFSNAQVTMMQNGEAITVTQAAVKNGYGENTLVWTPSVVQAAQSWPQPTADTAYQVTITNVIIAGDARTFTYTVTVFDPAQVIVEDTMAMQLYLPLIMR
ncbi:MAG: CAP domain-containing protein [Caldilineaceae bacterium]